MISINYVTFLDDFSRKIWVYLIKNKSDVLNIFIKFHKFVSNTTSYKIINFKSDNGTEYTNKTLTTYLENFGINFIHSVPWLPTTKWSCWTLKSNTLSLHFYSIKLLLSYPTSFGIPLFFVLLTFITWIHIRVLIIKFQMNYFSINQLIFLTLKFLDVKHFSITITKRINFLTITLNLVLMIIIIFIHN